MCPENLNNEKIFSLPYIKIGNGNKSAIAFHGFGQDGTYFNYFASVLGTEYTIYSFNLPYHTKEDLNRSEHPAEWTTLKAFFLRFLGSVKINSFTCIGFSIGAKLCLALLELFPEKIETMILMAPDGFRMNIWYKLATGSLLTRAIFKYIVYKPDLFFRLSDIIVKLKLIPPGVSRFARSQMSSLQKREKVYYTWMFFRKLRFSKRRILSKLLQYNISISIYLGSEDKIIRQKQFHFLTNNLAIDCRMIILQTGHNDLIEETARFLSKISINKYQ